MDEVLEKLKDGVRKFRAEVYPAREQMYLRAATETQRPHTLFIACADARVIPNDITQSNTGEVFTMRNIGNMVPPYGEMVGGVSAVIEFAVVHLHVRHIVVCGHSDCGAMKALLTPEKLKSLPTVTSWLSNARAALSVAETVHNKVEWRRELVSVLTEENVLLQLQHLRTHPSVAGAIAMGELTLSGWVYDIGKGTIAIASDGERTFVPVEI